MKKDIRIAIAESYSMYRRGLHLIIKELYEHSSISDAEDDKTLLQLLEKDTYDLIILDEGIKEVDCKTLVRYIIKLCPQTRVIVMGLLDDDWLIKGLYSAGCTGYFSKSAEVDEIRTAIETVMKGEIYYPEWWKGG